MGTETVLGALRRTLNEPSLLSISKQVVFNFTAGIIAVIDVERFYRGAISEDDHGFDMGIIF